MHRPFSPPALAAAAPDLAMAIVFLGAWIAPTSLSPGVFRMLVLVMLLEFIIIHCSPFLGGLLLAPTPPRQKIQGVLMLGGFYSIFVAAFCFAFRSAWPFVSFWGLLINRLLGVLLGRPPEGEAKQTLQNLWGASAALYLVGAFLTILPPIPRFGLTDEIVRTLDLPGSGMWIEQPHRLVAFGFLYFTATGVSELYGNRWARPADAEDEDRRAVA